MAKRRRTARPGKSPRRRGAGKPATRRTSAAGHVPRSRVAPAISGLAPGMQMVNPYLAVTDVAATMEFMENTLGFVRGVALADPDGQLRYAEMRQGDSVVMLVRHGDEASPSGGAAALYTYVQDVDAAVLRARESGAAVSEAQDRPWGDRAAVITDADGYRWVLATFRKLVPFS